MKALEDMHLGELFREAMLYGTPDIYTHSYKKIACTIRFCTMIDNTTLEARSGYNCCTPEEALISAILKAQEYVNSVADLQKSIEQKRTEND